MKFKLETNFKLSVDQKKAVQKLTKGLDEGYKHQTLLGVTGSGKTFTMANIIQKVQRPTLIISHNKTLAAQLAEEFQKFFPHNAVCYFVSYYDYYLPESYIPQTDTYIEKETSINEEIDRLRHFATQSLLSRRDVIIVASVSCIYGLGDPSEYENIHFDISVGQKISREEIFKHLIDMQYSRNEIDFRRGTFRSTGSVIDIFPVFSVSEIYRIHLEFNKVKSIQIINPLTMVTEKEVNDVSIYPATHYIAPQEKIDNILKQIQKDKEKEVKEFLKKGKNLEAERLKRRVEYDIEMIRQTGYCNGIENYSRYFDGRKPGEPPYTLLDYFPDDFLMFIDESHITIPQIKAMYEGDKSRKNSLVNFGFRLKAAYDNRPLKFKEFEQRINQVIYVSATPGEYELKKSQQIVEQIIRPTGLLDPKIIIKKTENQIQDLTAEIHIRTDKNQRVLVTTLTKKTAEYLSEYLQDEGIKAYYLHSEIDTFDRVEILYNLRQGMYDVVVGVNLLREGLDLPEVSLVAILDADKEGFLRSETSLIQTMGRAARHIDGTVIMYADTITKSMKKAIKEVERRRKIQEEYNKKHNIKPQSISKEIREGILKYTNKKKKEKIKIDIPENIDKYELVYMIENLRAQMKMAAENLEFEKAASLRDKIKELEQIQKKSSKDKKQKYSSLKAVIKE